MGVVVREVAVKDSKPKTDKYLPTIMKWKGVNMVRQESFLAAIKEVVRWAEEIDVTRVGIVGDMHSGKTTMAEAIAHSVHKESKLPWGIKILYEKDLMNFEETLKTLTVDTNWILRFDDVSFLDAKHNKKAISQVKEAVTKVRHLEGGKDVKIILIYNYHYSKGLDKYLRMADFRFFTTVGSEEEDNFEGIMGVKSMSLVKFFAQNRQRAITKKFFQSPHPMANKKKFFYKWRDPFIPVLFWNNSTLRMIISPTRKWLEPICTICSNAGGGVDSEINIAKFCEESEAKFTKGTFTGVIKQFLREQGVNTYSAKTVQARRYLDKALEMKVFNLEELALHYGLKETKTKMRKKLDGELTK
jgi:hypothetical protein